MAATDVKHDEACVKMQDGSLGMEKGKDECRRSQMDENKGQNDTGNR